MAVTQAIYKQKDRVVIGLTVVGAVSGGAVADTLIDDGFTDFLQDGGYLFLKGIIYPDDTTPMTALYDVYVKNAMGYDYLNGNGENQSQTVIASCLPDVAMPMLGSLTLDVDNNSVNSGAFYMELYFVR